MAEEYFPYDEGAGREVRENQWSKMARLWRGDGIVVLDKTALGTKLEVTPETGMSVNVAPGEAWVQGHYYSSDATITKTLASADPTNPRIDRIVLRNDWLSDRISVEVLQGTPDLNPTPPTLTQNFGSRWEIPLAQVRVNAGATEIFSGDITDERQISHHAGIRPACLLSAYTSTTIPEGGQAKLVWDVINVDTTGTMYQWFEDEIEIPEDGLYLCFFNVGFDANESSHVEGILRIREVDTGQEHDLGRSNEQGIQNGHEYSGVAVVRRLPKGTRVFVLGEESDDGDGTSEPASVIVSNYQPTFGVIKIAEGWIE